MRHSHRSIQVVTWIAGIAAFLAISSAAHAQSGAVKKIKAKNAQAMENYDLMEFEEARRLLNEAVVVAKKAKLRSGLVARTYLNLGIVYFAGLQDTESARMAFINAVEIDAKVKIGKAYSTPEMAKVLIETKKEYGGSGRATATDAGGGDHSDNGVACGSVQGLEHTLVDEAKSGTAKKITAHVGGDLGAKKVTLYYRTKGKTDFAEVKMKRTGECKFAGTLPAKALVGDMVHYYVAAFNKKGKKIASKGSSGSPNIIEVLKAAGGSGRKAGGDDENPLGAGETSSGDSAGDTSGEVGTVVEPSGPSREKLFFSVSLGTGGGYVTGATEQMLNDVGCCFAPALLHLFPEIGYYVKSNLSVSVAFRMGFPVGANLPGHATAAPAGLVRARYALDESGAGLNVSGGVGGGIIRHTIKLNDAAEGADVDTVASGPILLSAGAGYVRPLGGPMKFVAELNALAGIPGPIKELGSGPTAVKPNFALQFDINLGVLFAF